MTNLRLVPVVNHLYYSMPVITESCKLRAVIIPADGYPFRLPIDSRTEPSEPDRSAGCLYIVVALILMWWISYGSIFLSNRTRSKPGRSGWNGIRRMNACMVIRKDGFSLVIMAATVIGHGILSLANTCCMPVCVPRCRMPRPVARERVGQEYEITSIGRG